ncbi:hypothetical protein GCM10007897_41470 [Sphingobium jiangsuense]|uniref:Capsular polysaccharide biosynthesis protein n=1 Tax=Sphingobium jiangsuense TaxID=870476 RepID=A0A7W6FRL8_9SPHN|nr:glycosyltransferase family 61 protein [Sphingobium jiangsuense]MBB3927822.1 capsular polysaccharide biosynthesis protein [Sphingobium jiangsuense]GLT02725.1 hypothetical protein GCM10007897_41470 [Sphingobium jiangsuense]
MRLRRAVFERMLTVTYPLAELEEYAAAQAIPVKRLAPASMTHGPAPVFLRDDDLCDISGYEGLAPSPEINLFELNNAIAIGRTEFILKGGKALYPRVIDPATDAFMMELENRGKVDLKAARVSIFPRKAILREKRAISLLGQCNGNYAHWVTEVLARFVLVDDIPEFKGWPLLVDHPIHEKLLDALDFLNVSRRRIIEVRQYQRVEVEHLVYISPPSMTPPDTREFFETGQLAPPRVEQFHFSQPALAKLRERAGTMAQDCLVSAGTDFPFMAHRKIFLQRAAWSTGNGRLLRNADVVEEALREMDFEGVQIADYSFEGQVLTARQAKIVVSPIGAAISNLVFREPGCIAIILTPHYERATFYYFANLMAALGHHVIFVLGPQTRHGSGNIYNRDFRVSIRLLRQAILKASEIEHDQKIKRQMPSVAAPALRVVGE